MNRRSLVPEPQPIHRVDHDSEAAQPAGAVVATDDRELIQQWARQHSAEPATGEATATGPATLNVQDGGAGIRFNFPAASRFRPISWDEWFQNFTQYDLLFVYERDCPGEMPSGRYRIVPKSQLPGQVDE